MHVDIEVGLLVDLLVGLLHLNYKEPVGLLVDISAL